MAQSSVTVKGQITLPLSLRKKYGIKPKDIVTIDDAGDAIVIHKAKNIFEFEGAFGKAAPADQERKSAMVGASRHAAGDD